MDSALSKISSLLGNSLLAEDIVKSISVFQSEILNADESDQMIWSVFENSLNASIRDIENHPKGKLFKRLIEFGPATPDEPVTPESGNLTFLSDSELSECVQFIFSHMINRFKGELAELLAIKPCLELAEKLKNEKKIPEDAMFFFGEDIKEHRRVKNKIQADKIKWGALSKGADGLIVQYLADPNDSKKTCVSVLGVVEIKSMHTSIKILETQINSHLSRLNGGLKLGDKEYSSSEVVILSSKGYSDEFTEIIKIIVVPSTWQLSRNWIFKEEEGKRVLIPPPLDIPPISNLTEEMMKNTWRIILSWSREALEQAAYEMTYWYMSKVGESIFKSKQLPGGWEDMTPEEAGYNAIKMMLYYTPIRPISSRVEVKATKLYNVYSFGYPLGVDSKEMLWPEDLSN